MKRFAGYILPLLMLTCAAADEPAATPVADPKPILAELQRKMASVNTVYLEFTQEGNYPDLLSTPSVSHGVMLIERPDQIRWQTTSPFQSVLLGNRKSVAQFEFADGKWKKLDTGFPQILHRVMDQMALMNQGKLDALTADYTISAATNRFTILTMVPKDETVRSMMPAIEVHLLPDLSATLEVVMRQSGGNFTRIIFSGEKRDITFPAGTFDQAHPLDIAAVQSAVANGK